LVESLTDDLTYTLPLNYQKGAGDTYFCGKMMAKLARIVLIAEELGGMDEDLLRTAHSNLRSSIEIWLNGSALAPMIYDESWKGLVNCGCNFNGDDNGCFNTFPDCPGMSNPGTPKNRFFGVESRLNYLLFCVF